MPSNTPSVHASLSHTAAAVVSSVRPDWSRPATAMFVRMSAAFVVKTVAAPLKPPSAPRGIMTIRERGPDPAT